MHEPGTIPPGFSFLPAAEINASRNKVKPLIYNLPQNPLDKYDSGVIFFCLSRKAKTLFYENLFCFTALFNYINTRPKTMEFMLQSL